MIDILTLSAIAFFIVVGILVYVDRKNIEFKSILIMRRTERGIRLIDSIARSAPRFWNFVGFLSVPVAVLLMIVGLVILLFSSAAVLSGEQSGPGVAVILPSLSSEQGVGLGGFAFFLPLWFWLILITILLVPHEVFHGIIARAVKIPLKSVGLLLLLIFPGAFVEPDEKKLAKAKRMDRLKVYSAGAFANILTAAVIFIVLNFIFQPLVIAGIGAKVHAVAEGSPAQLAGIVPNMTITAINGVPFSVNSRNPIGDALASANPGDNVTLATDNETLLLELGKSPQDSSRPFLGVTTSLTITKANYMSVGSVFAVLNYASLIIYFAVVIAVINLLPWKPFDGGLVFETLFEYISPKRAKKAAKISTAVVFMMFLILAFGSSLLKLL